MRVKLKSWAKLFRAVNLPTVPGDVLAGAAAVCVGAGSQPSGLFMRVGCAATASLFIYMYGLADNDIVGAATDKGRPIPDGEISLRAARIVACLCLLCAVACGVLGGLPQLWWIAAVALTLHCAQYNRTKWPAIMGICRGLNVLCGGAAVAGWDCADFRLMALVAIWTLYIFGVTKYSEGEEDDPTKKRRVGLLIGALVYLQLVALLVFPVREFLIAGAGLLILLRLFKRLMPEVSAS